MKKKNIVIIAVVSVIVVIAAIITAIVVVNNNKRSNQVVQQPTVVVQEDEITKPEPATETVEEPTPVVENTNVDDSTTETVVDTTTETEVDPEEQVYTDFDAWVEELVNDGKFYYILIWNANTNKHIFVKRGENYQGLEEGDKVYFITKNLDWVACNDKEFYNGGKEYEDFNKSKFNGALYIEVENIKIGEENTIEAKMTYEDGSSSYPAWIIE